MPTKTVIVCYNSRYVQTWTVASKTLNGRWMYVEYMYGMHFINLFWIPRRERAKTTIYTLQISKMDAVKITRAYFQVVINVSSETAWTIIDQGLDDFDSLVEFTEADMKTLFISFRWYPRNVFSWLPTRECTKHVPQDQLTHNRWLGNLLRPLLPYENKS